MTVAVPTYTENTWTGDGSVTAFSFQALVLEAADLKVFLITDGVPFRLTIGTHYSVTGLGDPGGVTVNMVTAPQATQTLRVRRQTVSKQTVAYADLGKVPGPTTEKQLDRLAMAVQDLNTLADMGADASDSAAAAAASAALAIQALADALAMIVPNGSITPSKISSLPQDWIGGANVNRILRQSFYDDLNSAWYCTGSGDETEGFTDFIAAMAYGAQGCIAPFTHSVASAIVINKPIHLHGAGYAASALRTTNANADVLQLTSNQPSLIEGFRIIHDGGKADGAGIRIDPASSFNVRSTIRDMDIANIPTCVYLENAALATIEECYLVEYTNAGVVVDNVAFPDGGDSEVKGCTIDTNQMTGELSGVLQYRSGGLRVHSNKIMRGKTAYRLIPTGVVGTSILLIAQNSMEHQTEHAIKAEAGDVDFIHMQITANHLNGQQTSPYPVAPGGSTPSLIAIGGGSGSRFKHVTIGQNNIQLGLDGGTGIELDYIDNLNLQPNTIVGSTGASRAGVSVGANVNGQVMSQVMSGLTSKWVFAGGSQITRICKKQSGVVGLATNAPEGSFFKGPVVGVNFPVEFDEAPTVTLQAVDSTNGAIGGRVPSKSVTGFTAEGLGAFNASTFNLEWTALGL